MREFYLPSTGGGTLRCGIWEPREAPRAVVQLVHGIAEHIERYEEFGSFLAEKGIVLTADDHMGHGKSVGAGETVGYFPSGWMGAVDDERSLMEQTRERYPRTPYFLMGHSMGSFLTRTFLCRYADCGLHGAILSGTGWQPRAALWLGLRLCAAEARKYGERGRSDVLQRVIFGGYNRKFRPARTPNDWICTDPSVVDAYCADRCADFSLPSDWCGICCRGFGGTSERKIWRPWIGSFRFCSCPESGIRSAVWAEGSDGRRRLSGMPACGM